MNYKRLYYMMFNRISDLLEKEDLSIEQMTELLKLIQIDAENEYINYPYQMPKAVGADDGLNE